MAGRRTGRRDGALASPWLRRAVAATALASFVDAQQSQPNPCMRWSGMLAVANSPTSGSSATTGWYYGGLAKTSQDQSSNLWTNALVSLDLSSDWPTGTPPLTLVQADSGDPHSPPAVALGALWASADGNDLYLYGGQFSDTPAVSPAAEAIIQYSISDKKFTTVSTTGDSITRVAEGSPTIVPGEGSNDAVGYYFSGHEDAFTVPGWSVQVARIYLNSMVQFDLGTHAVKNYSSYASNGATSDSSTPETTPVYRADGTLTYIPGLGTGGKGILVAIGGATATQYLQSSTLDVFDLGTGGWTKQATLGETMGSRINHCAVRGTARVNGVDQHTIFIYGGQQLNQSDRDSAVYYLNIANSEYTWVSLGELSGAPGGRAGHQCALVGSQLVVMGGIVADDVICDQPGIFVFDTASSTWQDKFTASTKYSTPALLSNITGGTGTGTSTSGSGSGSSSNAGSGSDTSGSSTSGTDTSSGANASAGGSGSKTSIGPIIGGVVGGILAIALAALAAVLLMRRRRRQRQLAAATARDKRVAGAWRTNSDDSAEALQSRAYEKTAPHHGSPYGSFGGYGHGHGSPYRPSSGTDPSVGHASDDVEEQVAGMEIAGGGRLVPKQQLRVTNPGDE